MSSIDSEFVAYEKAHPIVVPDELVDPHPMTMQAAILLDYGKQLPWDKRDANRCWGSGTFCVRVHDTSVERSLRIIDAFTKACEARGFQFRYKDAHPYTGVSVVIDGEAITLVLTERMARTPYRPTKKELARQQRGAYVRMPVFSYRPSGELSLQVDRYSHSAEKAAWRDHPRRKLEARLNDVILGLRRLAATRIARRLAWEERERKEAEFERKRAELREQIADEQKAVDELIDQAEAWRQAKTIRAYAAAVKALAKREGTMAIRSEWIAWAFDQADRLDPLCISPPSILDTPRRQYRELYMHEFLNEDGEIEEA